MIDAKSEPVEHRPPRRRINNLLHPGARMKFVITRAEVLDNLEPVPHSKFYDRDFATDSWVLKDEYR